MPRVREGPSQLAANAHAAEKTDETHTSAWTASWEQSWMQCSVYGSDQEINAGMNMISGTCVDECFELALCEHAIHCTANLC
jgi:hypothetical protein